MPWPSGSSRAPCPRASRLRLSSLVVAQVVVSADVIVTSRPALDQFAPEICPHLTTSFASEDILHFPCPGHQPAINAARGTFTRLRPEGRRVRHRLGRNSIKVHSGAPGRPWRRASPALTESSPAPLRHHRRGRSPEGGGRRSAPAGARPAGRNVGAAKPTTLDQAPAALGGGGGASASVGRAIPDHRVAQRQDSWAGAQRHRLGPWSAAAPSPRPRSRGGSGRARREMGGQ